MWGTVRITPTLVIFGVLTEVLMAAFSTFVQVGANSLPKDDAARVKAAPFQP